MKFHFKLERAKGGYFFNDNNYLVPTEWFESKKTEEVITAEEIHKSFIQILHPYHDLVKELGILHNYEGRINYEFVFKYLDKGHKIYNAELESQTKIKILEFVNKFGLGIGDPETGSPESINPEHTLVGFLDEPHGLGQRPNLYNLLVKAVEMSELLLDRKSYETVPPKLKEICNTYAFHMKPQLNGGLYMETMSIFTTMYWTMAFTEYTYEVKECAYCQAPLLTDKRAKFCQAPRQCKNKFNNPNRKKKKESK